MALLSSNIRPFPKGSALSDTDTPPKKKRGGNSSSSSNDQDFNIASALSFISTSPDFDLLHELRDHKDDYTGIEFLSLYNFPSYLRTNLDRARARVETLTKPGLGVAISCCTGYGLASIYSNEHVKAFTQIKKSFDLTQDTGGDAYDIEELSSWFHRFEVSTPNPNMSGIKKQTIPLSDPIKRSLLSLKSELGCEASPLCILAVTITLSIQPTTLIQHREMMKETVEVFYRRLERRVRVAEAFLQTL